MTEDLKKLLLKVAQLRALASRAGTQHEAETAAAQADAIIAKYRIAEADLAGASATAEERTERALDPLDTAISQAWKGRLAYNLAIHYGCYVYRDNGQLPVYGRASDVAILRSMYAWVVVEIERMAQKEHGRADKNAFRLGAVSGFLNALRESTKRVVREQNAHSTALVLVDRARAAETLARAGTTLRGGGRVRSRGSQEAFNRGKVHGASMNQGRPIGAGVKGYLS